MLSSELAQEMAALIRSLEQRIRLEPALQATATTPDVLDHLERSIVSLIALYLSMKGRPDVH